MATHNMRFLLTDEHGIENILAWMKGHRVRMRLTQAQVAERMGCTQPQVSELEAGKSDLKFSTLLRYARALELQPNVQCVEPGEFW